MLFLAQCIPLPESGVPPHGSGAHVAASLAALRTHFEVEALGAPSEAARKQPHTFRRLVPAPVRAFRRDVSLLAADRAFTAHAYEVAQAFRPDAVYFRSEYFARSGLQVAKRYGVPVVVEVNGVLHRDVRTMYRSPLESLGLGMERQKLRDADAVVTVSPGLADLLEELGAARDRTFVVPNTVDPARVVAAPRRRRARRRRRASP